MSNELEIQLSHTRAELERSKRAILNAARFTNAGPYTEDRMDTLNQYLKEQLAPQEVPKEEQSLQALTAETEIQRLKAFIRKDYEACGGDTECECKQDHLCYFCESRQLLGDQLRLQKETRCQHGVWLADSCYSCDGLEARIPVYEAAKLHWGESKQVIAAAEEFSEASAAMCRHALGKARDVQTVITELADAEIMCEQMRLYFDGAAIDKEKDSKIHRLAMVLGVAVSNVKKEFRP